MKIGIGVGLLGVAFLGIKEASTNSDTPETKGGNSMGSSGTPECDYAACVSIYQESGGKEEPSYIHSSIRANEITLYSKSSKKLAAFSKTRSSKDSPAHWNMRKLYQ